MLFIGYRRIQMIVPSRDLGFAANGTLAGTVELIADIWGVRTTLHPMEALQEGSMTVQLGNRTNIERRPASDKRPVIPLTPSVSLDMIQG
jgi:hypothetical protein